MAKMGCTVALDDVSDADFVTIYQWKVANPGLIVSSMNPNQSASGIVLDTGTVAGVQSLHDLLAQLTIPPPAPIVV